jgi:hypothetical protein
MVTFAELVKTVEHLSEDEIDELREILRRRKEEEILKASAEATKEYEEGKTVSLKSPEEIEKFFNSFINDNH